tara:strand:- start:8045 stop:8878 length:834 start_codon:yes stop_codon:yes gene_type:complete
MMDVRVAFLGNSILYFNDCPRLLEAISAPDVRFVHDCCLQGGANLAKLLAKGSNMFQPSEASERDDGTHDVGATTVEGLLEQAGGWDFVIVQDHTQAPARSKTQLEGINVLKNELAPMIDSTGAIPILLATHAYREPVKGSEEFGTVPEFTRALRDGYSKYASTLAIALPEDKTPRVAPFGTAMLRVHEERPALWRELFDSDNFHLSPIGTFLEACVLHHTIFGKPPPVPSEPIAQLWARSRRMGRPGEPPLRFPSAEECEYLRNVATRVCSESQLV